MKLCAASGASGRGTFRLYVWLDVAIGATAVLAEWERLREAGRVPRGGSGALVLQRDGACLREGVARRPWMAGEMGMDGTSRSPTRSRRAAIGKEAHHDAVRAFSY